MLQKSRGHGQNIWTDEQRAVLLLLHAQTSFDSETRTSVFNHIFDDYLKSCGVNNGLPRSIVEGQYRERLRPRRERYWTQASQIVESEEHQPVRDELLDRINNASAELRTGEAFTGQPQSEASVSTSAATTATSQEGSKRQRNRWTGYADAEQDELDHLKKTQRQNGFDGHGFADWSYNTKTRKSRSATEKSTTSNESASSATSFVASKSTVVGTDLDREERDNDEEDKGTENAEDQEVRIHEQLYAAVPPPAAALEMLHASEITWKDNQASAEDMETSFISQSSAVYKHGGQVHRIQYGDRDIDCMVCDANICEHCGGESEASAESVTDGIPFVHSSDTIRPNKVTVFHPRPKANTGAAKDGYLRSVRFVTLDGVVRWPARVCRYVQCQTCSGSEHLRREENKEQDRLAWAHGDRGLDE